MAGNIRLNVGFVRVPANDMTFPSSGTAAVIPAVKKKTNGEFIIQCRLVYFEVRHFVVSKENESRNIQRGTKF